MIAIATEDLLTFSQACSYLPRRRRGRKAATSTIWRWATRGLRGVKLEVIRLGGQSYTSREALQRFADRLSGGEPEREEKSLQKMAMIEAHLAREGI